MLFDGSMILKPQLGRKRVDIPRYVTTGCEVKLSQVV